MKSGISASVKLGVIAVVTGAALLLMFANQYFRSSEYTRVIKTVDLNQVRIEPALLLEYAGTYELKPGFEVRVTSTDGRLFAQATDQTKVEFYPASDTVFFNEITPLLMQFERNDDGNIDRFRALEPGRSRAALRINEIADED